MTSCDLALENLELFLTFTLPLKAWHYTQDYWVVKTYTSRFHFHQRFV